jgi:hypothetical protein
MQAEATDITGTMENPGSGGALGGFEEQVDLDIQFSPQFTGPAVGRVSLQQTCDSSGAAAVNGSPATVQQLSTWSVSLSVPFSASALDAHGQLDCYWMTIDYSGGNMLYNGVSYDFPADAYTVALAPGDPGSQPSVGSAYHFTQS